MPTSVIILIHGASQMQSLLLSIGQLSEDVQEVRHTKKLEDIENITQKDVNKMHQHRSNEYFINIV